MTYFDEDTLRRILTEAGFNDVMLHPPEKWALATETDAATRARFDAYVATNPEMIAFTAVA